MSKKFFYNITLQFPGNTKYFRRDKRSKIRYRLLSEPKKGRAKFSAKNSYGLTKIYLETMGKAEEDICLGGLSGIYSRFGIRGYTSIEEHLKDKDYGPDLTRILPAFVYYPPKFPAEIAETRQFKEARKRNVVKILKRENNDLPYSDNNIDITEASLTDYPIESLDVLFNTFSASDINKVAPLNEETFSGEQNIFSHSLNQEANSGEGVGNLNLDLLR